MKYVIRNSVMVSVLKDGFKRSDNLQKKSPFNPLKGQKCGVKVHN